MVDSVHEVPHLPDEPGRILEVITPGNGFENYFRELGELLTSGVSGSRPGAPLHESAEFAELAAKYGLTYATPDWLNVVVRRYGLSPATH